MNAFTGEDEQGRQPAPATSTKTEPSQDRQPDAIYQNRVLVARVDGPKVDLQAKEIRFAELYNSDQLLLPDECEFQNYIILVQRVDFATKVEKTALHKGRLLQNVVAEILGYREQ
jgi:hypothetical protein